MIAVQGTKAVTCTAYVGSSDPTWLTLCPRSCPPRHLAGSFVCVTLLRATRVLNTLRARSNIDDTFQCKRVSTGDSRDRP